MVTSPYGDLVLKALPTLRPSFARGPKAFSVFMEGPSLLHSLCLLSGQVPRHDRASVCLLSMGCPGWRICFNLGSVSGWPRLKSWFYEARQCGGGCHLSLLRPE